MNQSTHGTSAAVRRAWALIDQARALLDEAAPDAPTPGAPYTELSVTDQAAHATAVALSLRSREGLVPVGWDVVLPDRDDTANGVEISGHMSMFTLPMDADLGPLVAAWVEAIGGTVEVSDTPSGGRQWDARGSVEGVPVELRASASSYRLARVEAAGGAK
ncbi:hypothetical protein [Nocardiopsis protaetiae]|uniref:hypothetical protein n=1 Tax=Nocardiopsis protaetiae TaxID=3382270 RepID=UPI00387B3C53